MSKIKLILLIAIVIAGYFILQSSNQKKLSVAPPAGNKAAPSQIQKDSPRSTTVAIKLQVPWALVFLPNKDILFTERPGRIRIIDNEGNLNPDSVAVINDVLNQGEGGLLGIAIHPNFNSNHFVYLYYTYSSSGNSTLNRVARFKFEENVLSEKSVIVDKIPGSFFHNGGRIKFGPDGFLYITTGDSQNPSLAQDINSLAGKILRVDSDGKPAPDNPFNNAVYSYGHRNPQGITWDNENNLWVAEHGPSARDELNMIVKGKNYGWPARLASQPASQAERGGQGESVAGRPVIQQSEMIDPVVNSNSDTWAPSGAAFLDGSIFFAGLRGEALYEYKIENKTLTSHLKNEIGRIREVVVGPDKFLYITTSNRDGRGIPDATDDKIIRINPAKL